MQQRTNGAAQSPGQAPLLTSLWWASNPGAAEDSGRMFSEAGKTPLGSADHTWQTGWIEWDGRLLQRGR